jgi:hypothetical protein
MEDAMRRVAILLSAVGVVGCVSLALGEPSKDFTLEIGQALRITPEGQVTFFPEMQADAAHLAEMERRAQSMPKGLAIWRGADGKLRYLTDPVEGPMHIRQ